MKSEYCCLFTSPLKLLEVCRGASSGNWPMRIEWAHWERDLKVAELRGSTKKAGIR